MNSVNRANRGQVLIMVTTSLIALCGIMGLAVDPGWGYQVKKSAQSAADAAALATAEQALQQVGQASMFSCGTKVTCQAVRSCGSPVPNPPVTNIDYGCLYALQNGFSFGGNNNRQNVTVEANTTTPAPTAPGVFVDYWATVRVTEQVPQLFSAVVQFPWAKASSRATAAVVDSPVPGSIYLIDRQNDSGPNGTGVNLSMQGGGSITATGAVYMASTSSGNSTYAGHLGGSARVDAAYVGIRGSGTFDNPSNVTPSPTGGLPDSQNFKDPLTGKGQPPPPTAAQAPATPVSGGKITGGHGNSCTTLTPGSYYAAGNNGNPTNNPISITGCVTFSAGAGAFGNYVFFGGVNFSSPGTVVTMAPGRYIFAGVNGPQNSVYSQSNGVTVQDQTPMVGGNMVANADAGELLVFTDGSYPGLYVPPALAASNFQFGSVSVQMGNNAQSAINLHGLNVNAAELPSELKTFAPTVMWQDQGNSKVLYDANGNIDTSCAGNINSPCTNNDPTVTTNGGNPSTSMQLQATPGLHLYGLLYQPRGAALEMQGSGLVSTPMVIITGTLKMGGSPTILQPLTNTGLIRRMVALVE